MFALKVLFDQSTPEPRGPGIDLKRQIGDFRQLFEHKAVVDRLLRRRTPGERAVAGNEDHREILV